MALSEIVVAFGDARGEKGAGEGADARRPAGIAWPAPAGTTRQTRRAPRGSPARPLLSPHSLTFQAGRRPGRISASVNQKSMAFLIPVSGRPARRRMPRPSSTGAESSDPAFSNPRRVREFRLDAKHGDFAVLRRRQADHNRRRDRGSKPANVASMLRAHHVRQAVCAAEDRHRLGVEVRQFAAPIARATGQHGRLRRDLLSFRFTHRP